jgi:hypothetical protein
MGKRAEAFTLDVPIADIADLSERLARTRFPDQAPGPAWAYGTDVCPYRKCAPWKGAITQWETDPPGKLSLQPVAIGAVVEVTKRLKPSMERVT